MNKYLVIFLVLLQILTSCSPPSDFNDDDTNQNNEIWSNESSNEVAKDKIKNKDPEVTSKKHSCYEGCDFYNRAFTTVKSLNKKSISFNSTQIKNFYFQCKIHCTKKFNNKQNKNNKQYIEIEEIEKETEEREDTQESDLTPFEDL